MAGGIGQADTPTPVSWPSASNGSLTIASPRSPARSRGCRELVRVTFAYTDRAWKRTEREVEPYRLVQTSHGRYLVARDVDDDTWRTFRADRIRIRR